eukprot:scaffold5550_cov35-Attheya_sp.AAC.1
MARLPSTLCLHKRVAGAGTQLASMHTAAVHNPLEPTLDIPPRYGKWRQAVQIGPPEAQQHAFTPLEDLWDEEVESDKDTGGNESEADEGNDGGDELGTTTATTKDEKLFSSDSNDEQEETANATVVPQASQRITRAQ